MEVGHSHQPNPTQPYHLLYIIHSNARGNYLCKFLSSSLKRERSMVQLDYFFVEFEVCICSKHVASYSRDMQTSKGKINIIKAELRIKVILNECVGGSHCNLFGIELSVGCCCLILESLLQNLA